MRLSVFTLATKFLVVFLCLPAHGQNSPKTSSGRVQKASEDKDPIAIVGAWRGSKAGTPVGVQQPSRRILPQR